MTLKKKALIGMGVVLIIAVLAILSLGEKPIKIPETALILPPEGFSEHAKYYDIVADYATSTPLRLSAGALADASARSSMYGFIRDTIAAFKTEGHFSTLTRDDIKMMGFDEGRKETLHISYQVISSAHTISYIYTIYQDTLGAHGNTFFRTFTFTTKTGKELSLADIFLPGTNYVGTLSAISRAKLPGIIGEYADNASIKAGTTPEEANFANFYFEKKDFVLLFDPYQVAPYAAGPQTLRIPLTQLSSILKPTYR